MGLPRKLTGGALAVGAAAAAAARVLETRPPSMPAPVAGVPHRYAWRHADLYYTTRGEGPAALLLHDLYTGASGAEMGPLGDQLAEAFTVHTADLPGFGRSGRPRMRYGPGFYFDAIVELVRHAIDEPTLLVGSGLTAAYVVEAAVRLGNLASGVVLMGPPEPEEPGIEAPSWRPLVYQLVRSPLGRAYHWWHASPLVQRRTLGASLAGEPADLDARAEALARFARQPDGHWPLWSLWSGDLAWDARPALARLGAPTLVLWGAEARRNPAAPEVYRSVRPDIAQEVVPGTARWPHADQPDLAAEAVLNWWATEGPAAGPDRHSESGSDGE